MAKAKIGPRAQQLRALREAREAEANQNVVHFNPGKTAKTIAVADAGIVLAKRMKDPEMMRTAIETKLRAQAEYVRWRDQMAAVHVEPKREGKGGKISALRSYLPPGDPGDKTAHRWRKALAKDGAPDETNISEAIEAVFHRIWRTVELEKAGVVRGAENTGEFERFTPSRYVEAARKVLGRIDLDPASCKQAQKIVQAKEFYTVDDDGLAKPWRGSVFLNPPYHRQLAPKFIDKLVAEIAAGRVVQAIMLVNNSTDASWFDVAARAAQSVCFTQTRINFCAPVGPDVNPTQGQAFLYYGEHGEKFEAIFCAIGWCTRPSRMYEAEAAQ